MPGQDVELLLDAHAIVGELPLWADGSLFWVDIRASALYRTDIETAATKTWSLPSEVGGYALIGEGAGAIVALRTGIHRLDFESGRADKLCDPPFDPRTHRFNDSACDANGRLWLGTMFDPEPGVKAEPEAGYLYSYSSEEGLLRHDKRGFTFNGFAWNPNKPEFFFADSEQGRIWASAFDVVKGEVGKDRVFAEIPRSRGVPDGAAFDGDGYYWIAIHGGGCLHRYAPDGTLDRAIELPIENPTKMAFCGPGLTGMCVTSASQGKPGKPHEGGLFRLSPGVRGHPVQSFAHA